MKEEQEAERIIGMYEKFLTLHFYNKEFMYEQAKQCALIHVNGIIEHNHKLTLDMKGLKDIEWCNFYDEYWQKVKSIIESK